MPLPAWERSSSAPCGAYNDDGLRTPWKNVDSNVEKSDTNINSEAKPNLPCLMNGKIKEEIIDDSDGSYKEVTEPNNKSSTNYATYINESMSETNTNSSDCSRTNGRKLISPSQRASLDRFRSTLRESKCKVSIYLLTT